MLLDIWSDHGVVLIDGATGAGVTASEVRSRARELSAVCGDAGLAFLSCDNSLRSGRDLLAAVEAGIPVALMDPGLDESMAQGLVERYEPDVLLSEHASCGRGFVPRGPGVWVADRPARPSHPELCVLLTTSGSTGSPKFVRLSRGNLLANARQIGASLGISAADRGVTALPLFYSFGMSVLTSHVLAGSSVVVSDQGVLDPGFWEVLGQHSVTFLPGVPASYGMLRRLGRPSGELPALRALIQAGGRLAAPLVTHFAELMRQRGGAFFVMYGQTEAAPRIACLPPDRLPEKLGSAGVALEGGSLVAMDGDRVVPVGEVGEIVYTGPNVMMGYAESRDDLVLGDTQGPSLRTGDLGYVDADGFLFLTGRSKRIAKLAGARVSLDEVEAMVAHLAPVAAVDAGDAGVALFSAVADQGVLAAARRDLARRLQVPPTLVSVSHMEQLPLLGSGKVDYRGLTERVRSGR